MPAPAAGPASQPVASRGTADTSPGWCCLQGGVLARCWAVRHRALRPRDRASGRRPGAAPRGGLHLAASCRDLGDGSGQWFIKDLGSGNGTFVCARGRATVPQDQRRAPDQRRRRDRPGQRPVRVPSLLTISWILWRRGNAWTSTGTRVPPRLATPTPSAEALEELSEPLDPAGADAEAAAGAGAQLAPEDEEPITVMRLLRDGSPFRLYEARQEEDEETLWLWERAGEGASSLDGRREHCSGKFAARCFPGSRRASVSMTDATWRPRVAPGRSLAEAVLTGAEVEPSGPSPILSQVAFALTKLHAAGFVHLGLRPDGDRPRAPVKVIRLLRCDACRRGPGEEVLPRRLFSARAAPGRACGRSLGRLRGGCCFSFTPSAGSPSPRPASELMAWEPRRPWPGYPRF